MKNLCIGISQIQNAPGNPFYADSRILRVIISPPEQNQYALLSGLETLTTGQKFNFQYTETNSYLTFVLMESRPTNFDIAYITVPLGNFHPNSFVQESQMMKALVPRINNPIISFDLQISSVIIQPINSSPINFYSSSRIDDQKEKFQAPFVPDKLNFSAIIKLQQPHEVPIENTFTEQNSAEYFSSDNEEEEEDTIINARIYFNDEIIHFLCSSQSSSESLKPSSQKQQQSTKYSIKRTNTDLHNKPPSFIVNEDDSKTSNNEENSLPYVPPEESDAPFLIPKKSLEQLSKSSNQNQVRKNNQHQESKSKHKLKQQSLSMQSISKDQYTQHQYLPQQQHIPQQQYMQQQFPQVTYPDLKQHDFLQPPNSPQFNLIKSNSSLINQFSQSGSNDSNSNTNRIQQNQQFQSQGKYLPNYRNYPQFPPNQFY